MFTKTAIAALFAGLVAGQATPTTPATPMGEPSGNPITRPLKEIVPACEPFTITWQPTTSNSVSMILLMGPPNNVVPNGPPIAVGISNSGSLTWTPASSLEATEGPNGYGLQIIDDVTGQHQYSTQFGISKGPACNSYVTPSPSSTGYGGGYPVSTGSAALSSALSSISSELHSHLSEAWSSATANATTVLTKTSAHTAPVLSTGYPAENSSVIQPSGSMSVPSSLLPTGTATTSKLPESTGAAAGLKAGLGMIGAAAAFAFML